MAYAIINDYIDRSLYPLKSPYTMAPEFVTIHNTANDATALNEIAYMKRNPAATSYHVAVDDKHVVQAIPFSRNAWHAGDGQGAGNRKSIGIEICYSKSGGQKYVEAEANAIEYTAHVLKQFGWAIDRVKWHRDWSGKNCPHRILAEKRETEVKNRIAARLAQLNGAVASTQTPVKEDSALEFSSPSLKEEIELTLGSKARRQMIVDKAIAAGYNKIWQEKLDNKTITDGDLLALGAGTSVRNSMAKVEDDKAK